MIFSIVSCWFLKTFVCYTLNKLRLLFASWGWGFFAELVNANELLWNDDVELLTLAFWGRGLIVDLILGEHRCILNSMPEHLPYEGVEKQFPFFCALDTLFIHIRSFLNDGCIQNSKKVILFLTFNVIVWGNLNHQHINVLIVHPKVINKITRFMQGWGRFIKHYDLD